ncbi:triose-phosphate isomerase [Marichromatium gracile]|uniref:Triosephosphate isomerase n=1 Tax=Marichromatium gracile TaxID=1048 RepID=A0ABR5VDP3_MARGR|nr:triose-phosphate isomerase [Marichromatium gracile]KXX63840.1 triose-phosphate isomerase [Marichromatium gracile]
MRAPLIAGNWKMNGSKRDAQLLFGGVTAGAASLRGVEVAVCPPFPYLALGEAELADGVVRLGAQDVSAESAGAYTGEVAAAMLAEFGCRYVICGHSERREYHAESDTLIARKLQSVIASGMRPILCIGETLEQRECGETEAVIAAQLDGVLQVAGIEVFAALDIAYEPVWAIGTGKTATPEQAQQVHAFVRARIAASDQRIAQGLRILYGGSMKPGNAAELLAQPDIDGGLIGGASLDADDFLAICRAAEAAAG